MNIEELRVILERMLSEKKYATDEEIDKASMSLYDGYELFQTGFELGFELGVDEGERMTLQIILELISE